MLRDSEKILNEVDVSLAIAEGTDLVENEVRAWSTGDNTEATEKLETAEPSHFFPALPFMAIPYEEAKAE